MPKETIQIIEKKINNILFGLCLFITIIAIGMVLLEFFSRGAFPPSKISTFYLGVLLVYSLHKEALRWVEKKGTDLQQRKGEYFVYTWICLSAILYLINFFSKDYFSYSPSGEELTTLTEITFTTLEVCAVFIFTRLLKIGAIYLFNRRKRD
ncbi:MAG: hypothetical protein QMC93_02675 [Patescibacteria group bacterium]|nr:hypothetical protein [Patescibacteria group bacterium]